MHWDHKQLDVEHKKLIAEGDQQQEKLWELREEVKPDSGRTGGRKKGVEAAKRLAKAAKEWMELSRQHHEETEHATMVMNKVQTTYETQLRHYKGQEEATGRLITQLKDERHMPQKINPKYNWRESGTLYSGTLY